MITFEIYQGHDRQFYWRGRSSNGMIVADGSEGYATRQNARRAVRRFTNAVVGGRYKLESQ